jgi:hypothetical protein
LGSAENLHLITLTEDLPSGGDWVALGLVARTLISSATWVRMVAVNKHLAVWLQLLSSDGKSLPKLGTLHRMYL